MSDSFGNEAFTLLSLGIVVICCRLAARVRMVGVRQLDFDDYLMCFVAVVYSLETATAYLVGARYMGLANNGMTDDERAALDPSSHEASLRRGGSKAQVIGWCLYTFVLWLLKICMNACYSRVTYVDAMPALVGFPLTIAERYQISHLETRVKVGWFLIGTSYIAVLLTILLGCRSFPKNWQIQPNPGSAPKKKITTTTINKMLWRALIPLKQKIGLTALFSAGVFVMVAGAIRCALILDVSDPAKGASRAGIWAVRESFVAVVIGNLPLIYPALLHRGVRRFASGCGGSGGGGLGGSGSRHEMVGKASREVVGRVGGGVGGGRGGIGGSAAALAEEEGRKRESFATDDSRGRIVKLGLEKGGDGMQRMVETEVQVEDGASASERGMSFSNAFEER
ncbi:hypothetical protein BK809_0003783 [Diplodia seriata]|uniref:Rhodopsin domain-containing protein n=1 Tax=Diplodia seriata TaxID=420778 RepID=A0A1S8BGG1_9PEZI|nr:hypothetical protein BK809_0003783 [Diplodia seriata]